MSEPRKTIVVNPDFLKFPMRGGRTKKNRENASSPKPIKIRSEDKTYKRRALNYIRKHQEDKYKQLMKGEYPDNPLSSGVGKTYADTFKNDFDDSLSFLQKLTDQNSQKLADQNSTLKQYPPHLPNSTLFSTPVLDQILDQNINVTNMNDSILSSPPLLKPTYGCLKGGSLPTYRTLKSRLPGYLAASSTPNTPQYLAPAHQNTTSLLTSDVGKQPEMSASHKLTPEQQRAELKHFLEHRKEEKQKMERVKRQRAILKPGKKQKRTTTRTFRVGKSKHYPKIGVLIPNKTIRTQVLAKKQKIRETPLEDVRRYLIKKGLIRVGSSCPNDVLRQMYESSMMMCGEIQNHNPDNLLYNYLNNGL